MDKIDQVLNYLNPRVVIAKTQIPHDNARANAPVYPSPVPDHRTFQRYITHYFQFHEKQISGVEPPADIALSRARQFLENSISYDGAVANSLSGGEGGINVVLNHICDGFKRESKTAYFNFVLDKLVDSLNYEEVLELMIGFKKKLEQYGPQSYQYLPPEQMCFKHREVIYNFINELEKHKNLWKYY